MPHDTERILGQQFAKIPDGLLVFPCPLKVHAESVPDIQKVRDSHEQFPQYFVGTRQVS